MIQPTFSIEKQRFGLYIEVACFRIRQFWAPVKKSKMADITALSLTRPLKLRLAVACGTLHLARTYND